MLMENSNTKKDNDANDSDQLLGPLTGRCFVKGQFSRLLANWCYDNRNQEDSCDTWTATGSKVCSEFSSCVNIKVQHRPYKLSKNLCSNKKKCEKKISSKSISQRNNGLSYFLRVSEQFKKNDENSSQENTLKSQKQSTASNFSTVGTDGQVSASNGGETVFDFKHFADPEEIVLEYIKAYIYKRSRLEKVDKRKISDSIIELRNGILKDTSAESNEPRTENILHDDKLLGIKVLKLGKRLSMNKFTPQRTTATSNFVFELGALDGKIIKNDRKHEVNTNEGIKNRRTTLNGQGKTRVSTNEKNLCFRRNKNCTSLLPELNSTELLRADGINKSGEKTFFRRNTVLPSIDRCWKNSNERENKTQKRVEDRKKPSAQVDAAISKSNWQILKQKRNLTYGNDCINNWQTKKLSDTLEKISNRICKEQSSHSDGKTDNYYEKEAIKTFRGDRIKDQEDFFSEVLNNRSKNATTWNKNDTKYRMEKLLKFGKEDRSEIETYNKFEVERYLDGPSQALNKESSDINHEEEITYPSSKVVADMLTKLDIYDVGFHINAKEDEESVTVVTDLIKYKDSEEVVIPGKLNTIPNCKQAGVKPLKIMVSEKREWEIGNDSELFGSEDKSSSARKETCGTSQTDKISIRNDNAFIKMGLKGLEGRIPRNLGTQILKSDFLKKELSFKPSRFLNRSVNFNNTLNSGSNLTDSIENNGSVTSQRGKWLKEKIRRFVANSTKEGKENSKINESSKFDNNYKKLYKIIEKKFTQTNDKKNFVVGTTKHSFVQKFFKVQNGILLDPRLQAVLPGLVDGIPNLPERLTR